MKQREIDFIGAPRKSKEEIAKRSEVKTEEHRQIARKFGKDFFDGDRSVGYGGYFYDGRWTEVVRRMTKYYQIDHACKILDIGCAKGYLLYDFWREIPGISVTGFDISEYAIAKAMPAIRPFVFVGNARELPFDDNEFDLVISLATLHNLPIEECKEAIQEIDRVSAYGCAYITLDAWRTDEEQARMENWNLTGKTMMSVDDWQKLFEEVGYRGDYYWIIP